MEELEPMIGDFKKKYQIKYNKEQKALKFYFWILIYVELLNNILKYYV